MRVHNLGAAASGPSLLQIDFEGAADGTAPVPPLAAGGQATVQLPIPSSCYPPGFSGRCRFRVTADAEAQVQEADEATTASTASAQRRPAEVLRRPGTRAGR